MSGLEVTRRSAHSTPAVPSTSSVARRKRNHGRPRKQAASPCQGEEASFWRAQPKSFRICSARTVAKTGGALDRGTITTLDSGQAKLIEAGQRKAPPCAARRPFARGSTPHYRRRGWTARCRQNNPHQELDPAIHQADAVHADRPPHSRDLEAATPYLHGMPRRLARQHD